MKKEGFILHSCTKLFQPYLRDLAEQYRNKHYYSQERMAELLQVTTRNYTDLKRGKHSFSVSSLIFLLLLLSDDEVQQFLAQMRALIKDAEDLDFME